MWRKKQNWSKTLLKSKGETYITDLLAALVGLVLRGLQDGGELGLDALILLPVLQLCQGVVSNKQKSETHTAGSNCIIKANYSILVKTFNCIKLINNFNLSYVDVVKLLHRNTTWWLEWIVWYMRVMHEDACNEVNGCMLEKDSCKITIHAWMIFYSLGWVFEWLTLRHITNVWLKNSSGVHLDVGHHGGFVCLYATPHCRRYSVVQPGSLMKVGWG